MLLKETIVNCGGGIVQLRDDGHRRAVRVVVGPSKVGGRSRRMASVESISDLPTETVEGAVEC